MFKKLMLLSVILNLGACETINQASQCDTTKNYVRSNPSAMEEYKELRKKGEVNSYYMVTLPTPYCNSNKCVTYNNNKFKFIEKYFEDSERKGVYTITALKGSENTECLPEAPSTMNRKNKYCYEAKKNQENKIKSRYKYLYDKTSEKQTIIKVVDLEKEIELYEYSYQVYSHRAVGGPGFGTCPSTNNNPDYKFNAVSFLIDN